MADEIIYDPEYLATLEEDVTPVSEDFDPDADYAMAPPPIPDGWHQFKLRNLGAKDSTGTLKPFVGPRPWGNIPQTFFTQIEGVCVDPSGPQDGKRTTRYNVTTHADARQNNASSASLAYKALTGKTIPGATQGAQMAAFIQAMQEGTETLVWGKTQLEGESPDASQAYSSAKKAGKTGDQLPKKPKTFRGAKAFTDEKGKLTGVLVDPETGERVVGRPALVDLKPASFVPPVVK